MVLLRILHPVQTFINKTPHSYAEIKRKKEVAVQLLTEIKIKCDKFLENFQKKLNKKQKRLNEAVTKFIKSTETKNSICSWTLDDIPVEEYWDSWSIIDNRLDLIVEERVTEVLTEWENKTKSTRSAQEYLFNDIESNTNELEGDLEQAEKTIRGSMINAELIDSFRSSTEPSIEVTEVSDREELFKDIRFLIPEKLYIAPQQQKSLFRIRDAILLGPNLILEPKYRKEKLSQDRMTHYKDNKVEVVKKKAEAVYHHLYHGDVIPDLFSAQLEPFMTYAREVSEKVPKMIKANTALIKHLKKDIKLKHKPSTTYSFIENALVTTLEDLIRFSYKSVKEYNISFNSMMPISLMRPSIRKPTSDAQRLSGGLFAGFIFRTYKPHDRGSDVSIKTYSDARLQLEKYKEENNLRSNHLTIHISIYIYIRWCMALFKLQLKTEIYFL